MRHTVLNFILFGAFLLLAAVTASPVKHEASLKSGRSVLGTGISDSRNGASVSAFSDSSETNVIISSSGRQESDSSNINIVSTVVGGNTADDSGEDTVDNSEEDTVDNSEEDTVDNSEEDTVDNSEEDTPDGSQVETKLPVKLPVKLPKVPNKPNKPNKPIKPSVDGPDVGVGIDTPGNTNSNPTSNPSDNSPPSSATNDNTAATDGNEGASSSTVVSTNTDVKACFPADATVETIGGSRVTMKDLKIGMKVRTASGFFSEVYFFSHANENIQSEMIEIVVEDGSVLIVSPKHYIMNGDGGIRSAETFAVNGSVVKNGKIMKIISVDRVMAKGLFNPHTVEGDIVVNGFHASCYTTDIASATAHSLLAPIRVVSRIFSDSLLRMKDGNDYFASLFPSGMDVL